MTDESTTPTQTGLIDSLLDNAVGAPGYYGVFGANMHTDNATASRRGGHRRLGAGAQRAGDLL